MGQAIVSPFVCEIWAIAFRKEMIHAAIAGNPNAGIGANASVGRFQILKRSFPILMLLELLGCGVWYSRQERPARSANLTIKICRLRFRRHPYQSLTPFI